MAKGLPKPEWQVYEEKVQGLLRRLPHESHRLVLGLLFLATEALPHATPEAVAAWVAEEARKRARLNPKARPLLRVAQEEPELLLEGARWILWWRGLPREQKLVYRRYTKTGGDEARMLRHGPSERQLAYLEALGYRGQRPTTRLEASLLIDDLVSWRESLRELLGGKPSLEIRGRLEA